MKKNFFKKLSFVMALAMMVTMIAPAAGALAASGPALNSTKKYLHLSGITGASEYDFNISGKKEGWKYSWTSANEDVAVVDEKSGLTVAKGVGTTKVTVAITKADGTDVKELSADVVVRDNIETVAIANAPEKALAIDEEYDFNRSFVTESGSTAKTSSVTRWTVDKDTTATITAGGVFKATLAGDYKVTATSFQSKAKYEAWKVSKDEKLVLATADVTVKVASEIKSVTQVDGTTVKVEFTSPMESVTTSNLIVSYLMSATPIQQTVKSIAASDDKKTYTVVMYNAFTAGSSYRVAYSDLKAVDFTAATTNVADVASIKVTTGTATTGIATDVVVKLYNAAGVDITTTDLLNRVTLTNVSTSGNVYFDTTKSPKEITMFTIGDTTTVTAVYHTYDYDPSTGVEKNTLSVTGTITCVATSSISAGTIAAWSIAKSTPADNFASVNHVITAGDVSYNLYVRSLKTDGTYLSNIGTGDSKAANWKFTSSDETVLNVYKDPTGKINLFPIKAGTVTLVAEYSTDAFATTTSTTVVGAITITVSSARVATTINLSPSIFSLTNALLANQSVDVSIDVDDQYGVDMDEDSVSVSKITADSVLASNLVTSNVTGTSNSVTFSGVNAGVSAAAGTYTYKITANGLTKVVVITVNAPKDASGVAATSASYYKLNIGALTYDLALSSSDLSEVAHFQVYGYAANGIAYNVIAATGAGYTVEVLNPDGVNVTPTYGTDSTVTLATGAASGVAVKLATGTWTVKLYNSSSVLADVKTFVVKDTQVQPLVAVATKIASTTSTTISAAINECFTATLNNVSVSGLFVTKADLFGAGTTVYVKNVRYYDATTGVTYTIAVTTNIAFTASNLSYDPANYATDSTVVQ
jgi:hypothetical protein